MALQLLPRDVLLTKRCRSLPWWHRPLHQQLDQKKRAHYYRTCRSLYRGHPLRTHTSSTRSKRGRILCSGTLWFLKLKTHPANHSVCRAIKLRWPRATKDCRETRGIQTCTTNHVACHRCPEQVLTFLKRTLLKPLFSKAALRQGMNRLSAAVPPLQSKGSKTTLVVYHTKDDLYHQSSRQWVKLASWNRSTLT